MKYFIASLILCALLLRNIARGCNLHTAPEGTLVDAAKNGDYDTLTTLLERGADVDSTNAHGQTLFHIACKNGNMQLARILLQYRASITSLDENDFTPVHFAALGKFELMDLILTESPISIPSAVIEIKNKKGRTPLHLAAFNKDPQVSIALIERGADMAALDSQGQTPLHLAVLTGNTDTVVAFLKRGASVDMRNANNDTLLHLAAQKGCVKTVSTLLEHHADIFARNNLGQTPLHTAASCGFPKVIDQLLEQFVSPPVSNAYSRLTSFFFFFNNKLTEQGRKFINTKDHRGCTPLHLAAKKGHVDAASVLLKSGAQISASAIDGETPLHLAAKNGHSGVISLLIRYGAPVYARDNNGMTPLHWAANNGHTDVCALLISKSFLINIRNNNGYTPLHCAAEKGHSDAVILLIRNRARVNATDKDDMTPLHRATRCGFFDAVTLLINNGAVIDASDIYASTPLHYAANNGHSDVCALLISSGAKVDIKDGNDRTPLLCAAERGHSDAVISLIRNDAAIDATDSSGRTPFRIAARYKNSSCTRLLMGHQDAESLHGILQWNELHHQVYSRNLNAVEAILNTTPQSIALLDVIESTALHWAAWIGDIEMVNFLLGRGAAVMARDKNRQTPLHLAAQCGHAAVVAALLTNNHADPVDWKNRTPLHLAAQSGHWYVVELLLSRGASADALDKKSSTPIHLAIQNGHIDVVKALAPVVNLNIPNVYSKTPLHVAALYGHWDIVRFLCKKGAKVVDSKKHDYTPLYPLLAILTRQDEIFEKVKTKTRFQAHGTYGATLFHLAAEHNLTETFPTLATHIPVTRDRRGWLPAHCAVSKGHMQAFALLSKMGPFKDADLGLALDIARRNGQFEMFELLIVGSDNALLAKRCNYPTKLGMKRRL